MGIVAFDRGAMMSSASYLDEEMIRLGHKPKRPWSEPRAAEVCTAPRSADDIIDMEPHELHPGAVIWIDGRP